MTNNQYTQRKRKASTDRDRTISAKNYVLNTGKKEEKEISDNRFYEKFKELESKMNLKLEELKSMIGDSKKKEEYYKKNNDIRHLDLSIINLEEKNKKLESKITHLSKKNEKDEQIIIDLNNNINKLKREGRKNKEDIFSLKKKNQKYQEDIFSLKKKNQEYQEDIFSLKIKNEEYQKDIYELKRERERQRKIDDNLSLKIEDNKIYINELLIKNENLENEVSNLKSFVYKAKLRQLLKKLFEYIIKTYYNNCMQYDKKKDKLLFIYAPNNLRGKTNKDVKALNKILEIIFKVSKRCDYSIHFVDEDVFKKNKYKFKSNIVVFSTTYDFFHHFDILEYEKIVLKYIPKEYFTIINDSNFEPKVPDLLSYCK